MDQFNEGLESFDEDGLEKLREEFKKEFKEMEEGLQELSKNINELKDTMNEAGESLDNFSESLETLDLKEFDESLEDIEEDEVSDYLKERFFLVGVDDHKTFDKFIAKEIPDYGDTNSVFGFTLSELEMYHDKFKEYGITALFMKYELMIEASQQTNDQRMFSFEPIKGEERKGILIPVFCDLNKSKPKRDCEIDEIDINILGNKLDAFNKGEISFEEFLGSV